MEWDIFIIVIPQIKYFSINALMHPLEFIDLDPFVLGNIESLEFENTTNFHNLLLPMRIPILIIS